MQKAKTVFPKAGEVQTSKAELKGKTAPVPKAGGDPRVESKEEKKTDRKTEVKKEKGSGEE